MVDGRPLNAAPAGGLRKRLSCMEGNIGKRKREFRRRKRHLLARGKCGREYELYDIIKFHNVFMFARRGYALPGEHALSKPQTFFCSAPFPDAGEGNTDTGREYPVAVGMGCYVPVPIVGYRRNETTALLHFAFFSLKLQMARAFLPTGRV